MYFLTHCLSPSLLAVGHYHSDVGGTLQDTVRAAFGTWTNALHGWTFVNHDGGNLQRVDVRTFIVLGICNGRFQYLLHQTSRFTRAEGQQVQSLVNRQTTYLISNQASLLGRSTGKTVFSDSFHHLPLISSWPSYQRHDRDKYELAQTHPACDRSFHRKRIPVRADDHYGQRWSNRSYSG